MLLVEGNEFFKMNLPVTKEKGLKWPWQSTTDATYLFLILGMMYMYSDKTTFLCIGGSFLFTIILFPNSIGTMWCFIAAFIPMALYFSQLKNEH
jgi:predicted membrane protein